MNRCRVPTALCLLFSAVVSTVSPQQLIADASPSSAGLDQGKLDEGVALYRDAVLKDEIKGAVLLVVRKGALALHEAVGFRIKEEGAPMPKDALFRLASNTKPMTAALVLSLVDEGRLSLDDPVSKFIPSFGRAGLSGIRIRHLLSHTGGLAFDGIFISPLESESPEIRGVPNLQREVARFAAFGAKGEPGSVYRYSNAGYNTLGAVIEVAAGRPLARLMKERLFERLGLSDARTLEPEADQGRMCWVYRKNEGA
jgi:CubicO group peptidase (beta-lactamase class C family)